MEIEGVCIDERNFLFEDNCLEKIALFLSNVVIQRVVVGEVKERESWRGRGEERGGKIITGEIERDKQKVNC